MIYPVDEKTGDEVELWHSEKEVVDSKKSLLRLQSMEEDQSLPPPLSSPAVSASTPMPYSSTTNESPAKSRKNTFQLFMARQFHALEKAPDVFLPNGWQKAHSKASTSTTPTKVETILKDCLDHSASFTPVIFPCLTRILEREQSLEGANGSFVLQLRFVVHDVVTGAKLFIPLPSSLKVAKGKVHRTILSPCCTMVFFEQHNEDLEHTIAYVFHLERQEIIFSFQHRKYHEQPRPSTAVFIPKDNEKREETLFLLSIKNQVTFFYYNEGHGEMMHEIHRMFVPGFDDVVQMQVYKSKILMILTPKFLTMYDISALVRSNTAAIVRETRTSKSSNAPPSTTNSSPSMFSTKSLSFTIKLLGQLPCKSSSIFASFVFYDPPKHHHRHVDEVVPEEEDEEDDLEQFGIKVPTVILIARQDFSLLLWALKTSTQPQTLMMPSYSTTTLAMSRSTSSTSASSLPMSMSYRVLRKMNCTRCKLDNFLRNPVQKIHLRMHPNNRFFCITAIGAHQCKVIVWDLYSALAIESHRFENCHHIFAMMSANGSLAIYTKYATEVKFIYKETCAVFDRFCSEQQLADVIPNTTTAAVDNVNQPDLLLSDVKETIPLLLLALKKDHFVLPHSLMLTSPLSPATRISPFAEKENPAAVGEFQEHWELLRLMRTTPSHHINDFVVWYYHPDHSKVTPSSLSSIVQYKSNLNVESSNTSLPLIEHISLAVMCKTMPKKLLVKILNTHIMQDAIIESKYLIQIFELDEKTLDYLATLPPMISIVNRILSAERVYNLLLLDCIMIILLLLMHMRATWSLQHTGALTTVDILALAGMMLPNAYFVKHELDVMLVMQDKQNITSYLLDFWNINDWVVFSFVFTLFVLAILGEEYRLSMTFRIIAATGAFALWLKVLGFMKLFGMKLATFILCLFQIARDISSFMMVLIVVMLGFTNVFFVVLQERIGHTTISSNDGDESPFSTVGESLLSVYRMMLGDFERDWFRISNNQSAANYMVLMFAMYMFIVTIILLNILIAVVSDSYDYAMIQAKTLYLRARLVSAAEVLILIKGDILITSGQVVELISTHFHRLNMKIDSFFVSWINTSWICRRYPNVRMCLMPLLVPGYMMAWILKLFVFATAYLLFIPSYVIEAFLAKKFMRPFLDRVQVNNEDGRDDAEDLQWQGRSLDMERRVKSAVQEQGDGLMLKLEEVLARVDKLEKMKHLEEEVHAMKTILARIEKKLT